MVDRGFFQQLSVLSPFRQGDVIKRDIGSPKGKHAAAEWGVIITADCDIAQEKMGDYFTYLLVRSAHDYVETIWASEELAKLRDRHGRTAVDHILRADQARDPNATPLTFAELSEWAHSDGPDAVIDAVKIVNNSVRKKVAVALEVLMLADNRSGALPTPLDRLRACWKCDGKKESEHRTLVQGALKQRQMRSDYMLTPSLPSESDLGFVVMLRDIRTIKPSDLFASRLDLRIGGGSASAMYRIGRFSDFIRYAITQRMANLFSRIGMTEQFENDCEAVASLTSDTLIPSAVQQED